MLHGQSLRGNVGDQGVKIYIALNSETGINTQFKNKSEYAIITKTSVLLPTDYDKSSLLFTKRLIGYS